MFRKIKLLFLTFYILHKTVESIDISTIYDIKAIENFVDILENTVENNYKLENTTMSDDDKYQILKLIFDDMTNMLRDLNRIVSDFREDYSEGHLNRMMNLFDDHNVKSGISRWSISLFDYSAIIEVKRDIINKYVRGLLYLHEKNYLTNMNNFCSYLSGVASFLEKYDKTESIADIYKNFLTSILINLYYAKDWLDVCGQRISLNKELFDYYRNVMTLYIKMWTMYYYVGVLKAHCKNEKPNLFMVNARNTLIEKLTDNMRLNKKIIIENNKYHIYQCDGQVHGDLTNYYLYRMNKKLYYELESMIQTLIINENNISRSGDCSYNCNLTKIEDTNKILHQNLTDCRYFTDNLSICETNKNDSRNYQWFKDSKGIIYGNNRNQSCSNKVKSLSRFYQTSTLRYCNYCICIHRRYPENKENVITAISFRDQVSNINDNMVVVGIRFVKKDKMIQVQIKEGKLGWYSVNKLTPWKEVENFIYREEFGEYYIVTDNSTGGPLTLGLDYGHPKIMNFDDLIAPQGYVITGVRFRFAGDLLDSSILEKGAIELQIRVSPFDNIQKKIIDQNLTHWISPVHKDKRDELVLNEPDIPTKSIENNIDSEPGQFIKFQASDLKKDAGQSTVPFFDALPAEGDPGFPLGGVGIIHRGSNGSGGYLAFKIFDLDISHDFKVALESEQLV